MALTEFLDTAELVRAMPAQSPREAGALDMDGVVELLSRYWTAGHRHDLNRAAVRTMLREGIELDKVQEIIDAVRSAAGDMERRQAVVDIEKEIASNGHVYGVPKLLEIMGRDATTEFMELIGGKPPADPLPITIRPIDLQWTYERLPPQEYIVAQLVPPKCVTLLIAEGGVGKTGFALHIAVCVATGRPLFGHATAKGRVVYVGREDNEESQRRRFFAIVNEERQRMRDDKELPPEAFKEFDRDLGVNFYWAAAVGIQMHLISTQGGEVTQTALVGELQEKLPPETSLLILDPLARFQGGEENSNAVGTGLVDAAELLAQRAGCAVLFPHHTGKVAAKEQDMTQYSARGASGLVDSSRSAIRLAVVTEEDAAGFSNVLPEVVAAGDLVIVKQVKNSMGRKADAFYLWRRELGFQLFVPVLDGGVSQDERLLERLHAWWSRNGKRTMTRSWLDEARVDIFGKKVPRNDARRAFDAGVDSGILVEGEKTKHAKTPGYVFRDGWVPDAM